MIPTSRRSRPLVLVPVLAVALSACGSARPPAATVDGVEITDQQVANEERLFSFLAALSGQPCGQPGPDETEESACARLTLSNLIQQDIVTGYAAAHDVSVSADRAATEIEGLQTQVGQERLDSLLKQNDVTLAELRNFAQRLLLFREVRTAVGDEELTDEQIQEEYDQNALQYTQLHAAHILVDSQDLARTISQRATGRNFADLARRYSTDQQSAQNGGDLAPTSASTFVPEFSSAALALEEGEISAPVQTQFGWHVIRLISAELSPLDEVRDQIVGQLSDAAFTTWLQERYAAADITVNPRYGRFNADTGTIEPIRSTATGGATQASPQASPSP